VVIGDEPRKLDLEERMAYVIKWDPVLAQVYYLKNSSGKLTDELSDTVNKEVLLLLKQREILMKNTKTLDNTSGKDVKEKVSDVKFFGNPDLFQLTSRIPPSGYLTLNKKSS
jgi:hypothetical protein